MIRKPILLTLVLVMALAVSPVLADSPETGTVSGTVSDPSGTVLPGVIVTLRGEKGDKTAITDADGSYRFALVPPGSYTLSGELEGFGAAEGAATVTAGGRFVIDLTMSLTTTDEITVTSEAPMVDKFNVTAGATMQAETAGEISATVRSFYGALQVLPGVTNDVESADLSQSRPTVNGALWQESNVYVDGVDATYSMRGGGTRVFLPTSALTEVNMEAGGGAAEYGRNVGSHTNLIVKSGTNQFHGDIAAVYSDQSWNENYESQPSLALDERFVRSFEDMGQTPEQAVQSAADWVVYKPGEQEGTSTNIEASIGGPIVRDKLWFFVARGETSTSQLDKTLDGQVFNNSSELFATIGKLNAQPTMNHSLAYTYIDAPVDRIFLLPPMYDRYTATFFDLSGDVNSLSWNWSINSDYFLETKLARQVSDENRRRPFGPDVKAQDPNFLPNDLGPWSPNNNDDIYAQAFDNTWHNGWLLPQGYGLNEFPRDQANVALTQFIGADHELKYGLDYQQVEWNQAVQRPDGFQVYDFQTGTLYGATNDCIGLANDPSANNEDSRCFYRDYNGHGLPLGSGKSDGSNLGAYVRDRFTVGNHWTFNAGLRVEQQDLSNDRGRNVIDSTNLSPRISAVFDFKGDGRQLLTFNAGRFFVQTPQFLVNAYLQEDWNGASNANDLRMHINSVVPDLAAAGLPSATLCNILAANPGFAPLIDLTRTPYCFSLGSVRPGRMWELQDEGLINVDIDPYHRDEFVLGYEWQFSDNWALDAKGIYWEVDNLIGSTLQRDNTGRLFLLTGNYDDYRGILSDLNFTDNYLAANAGQTINGQAPSAALADQVLAGFEDDNRNYQGLQLQLNRRFRNGWALYNNITFSKVEGKTYGGDGANDVGAFNNLDDDYGRNMETVLTDQTLDAWRAIDGFCQSQGLGAGTGCIDALEGQIGQPLSTVNRDGELPVDRSMILKTYGFKTWQVGEHGFNLGGLFVFQSGSPWQRSRAVTPPTVSLLDVALRGSVNTFMVPRGTFTNEDHFWVNLSGAWTFPLVKQLDGQLRVEVTNVTDEQAQIATSDRTGAPLRSRRSFQQPRKYRFLFSIRF